MNHPVSNSNPSAPSATAANGHARPTLPGPAAQAMVARDTHVMSPSLTRPYPLVIERGRGAWVWDVDGHDFLDLTSGIAVTSTGHSHPRVVAAIKEQAERFIHMAGTDFYYGPQVEVAERLIRITPGDFHKQVFLTNSGTEAIEAAFKLARFATKRHQVIAFLGAFHGRSMGALSLTSSKAIQKAGFGPLIPGVHHVPYPNPYRPPFGATAQTAGQAVLDYIENELFRRILPSDEVAAIFVEALQGEGGYVTPPADFLPGLRALCDRHGILLVIDEIQTGMGRTGKWWACDHVGVAPDILTSAKGLASGMPLGAMVANVEHMTWKPGAHGTTFGGNPVCCAAAVATIDVIEGDGLLANAQQQGERFVAGLERLAERYPVLGHPRGTGLWLAVEILKDPQTREPDKAMREAIVRRAFDHRLLLLGAGEAAIRFMPPLVIDADEVDEGLRRFEAVLAEVLG